ncbi:MAG: aminotransferase class I/II-fold pyridoxal phosphate-dependent enzyme [Methanocellales archaeon]|nr:aminotransferase class I/II-fold pyridoxal phosphate-dependent enzyme [Methanocellales archaeon]MDD3291735.1 aminotransferase class I/II-fold pyridoxal phosphate-dependent enzyme [Methanocellales archaeon]MDD5235085.1 aminotransferase class I/II-fold pyridoxal phosphate-dependent enzyme [Methanocellales archaeon]MDD5485223.1 aminotransferase class I/II-fold pyridoxal phosphate-dependent enzyme [Methanocellales archaeon]
MIADKVKRIPPSGIRKYFEMTLGMEDIISLGVGEPDFVTPWSIREACIYALEKGYTSYTSNWGLLELRNEISRCIASDYEVQYSPEDQIIVTTGVSEASDLAIRAIVNPGDEVIIVEPCYVSYKPCVILAGGKPVMVSTDRCNDFKVIPEQIGAKITKKTKAIILSYPNNPTGAIMGKKDLEGIADIVKDHDLFVISDEVYDKLTYDGTHTCFSSLDGMYDKTILLNGFSKAYAMTGWRLGYAASNPEVIAAMLKIHQYTMLCAPITAQMAAIEALRNCREEMLSMVREYDRRRRLIVKGLNDLGLDCFEPKGAFYAFPSVESTGMTSEVFAEKLLKEQKVAVVPGDVFGDSGEGFIRCAYAVSRKEIKEALERIGEFLK